MQVVVCSSPAESADLVAAEILRALSKKPDLVLGLATGSTPVGVYERLIRAHQQDGVDFSAVRTFNLDEYIGLSSDHPQSYHYFMREKLFHGLNIPEKNIHFPPVSGKNLEQQFVEHEETIQACGGIDIQILGIGSNGHIGFNEPTSSLASRTRVKTLTDKTLKDNSRFYAEDEKQPQLAVTLGIATILEAERIFLQAFGANKAEAVRQCVEGPISSFWPASVLQMHEHVTAFLDDDSSSRLLMVDYYKRARDEEKGFFDETLWP